MPAQEAWRLVEMLADSVPAIDEKAIGIFQLPPAPEFVVKDAKGVISQGATAAKIIEALEVGEINDLEADIQTKLLLDVVRAQQREQKRQAK